MWYIDGLWHAKVSVINLIDHQCLYMSRELYNAQVWSWGMLWRSHNFRSGLLIMTWCLWCCRNLVVFSTPGLSRKPSRASRLFTMSIKANPPPKVPQPERLDEVYEALKKGLQWVYTQQMHFRERERERAIKSVCVCVLRSYLQVHQMDLDTLTRQIKESKRNSRLVCCYFWPSIRIDK